MPDWVLPDNSQRAYRLSFQNRSPTSDQNPLCGLVGRKRNKEGRRESAIKKTNVPETSRSISKTRNGTNGVSCMHRVRLFFVGFPEAVLRFCPQRAAFFSSFFSGKEKDRLCLLLKKKTFGFWEEPHPGPLGEHGTRLEANRNGRERTLGEPRQR